MNHYIMVDLHWGGVSVCVTSVSLILVMDDAAEFQNNLIFNTFLLNTDQLDIN